MRFITIIIFLFVGLTTHQLQAQEKDLTYYLPDIEYDQSIPTPESYLGWQIGEWHITHDQLVGYMKMLAATSPRVTFTEFGRTYEERPLCYLTITSEDNQTNIENIRTEHLKLVDASTSKDLNIDNMPAVVYAGYSIHGNEPSGANAAPLVAYYLAAGKSAAVDNILNNTVVVLDPAYNPDGINRFASWANTHKGINLNGDPQTRELNEAWPRGRTNHYWFDLNRDWLPVQHPESQGRIYNFYQWRPNVLTDHHEMGANATYFFQPGVPQRTNPLTPQINQDLTKKIGTYHAAALDKIGSLYYSEESYDDFYYGKGSTYPDVNGAIGILFEQASSRGHLQQTENGALSFPFTIRNQVTTSFSTLTAAMDLRKDLLSMQRDFYLNAADEAAKDARKAYVFNADKDPVRLQHFLKILSRHQIKVNELAKTVTVGTRSYTPMNSYIVPVEQQQYKLIRAIFETETTFKDSLFYDVSSWTLPLAFNLNYTALKGGDFSKDLLGTQIASNEGIGKFAVPALSTYAYLLDWADYYAPKALYQLQKAGLRLKVSPTEFRSGGRDFKRGTIIINVQNQDKSIEEVQQIIGEIAQNTKANFHAANTGLTPRGNDLGGRSMRALEIPKVMLVVGDGVNSYDAGEVWHLLDQRYAMPTSMVETDDISRYDLDRYNVIVMVDGSYSKISTTGIEKLKRWVMGGGTIIAMKRAINWLNTKGLANVKLKKDDNKAKEETQRRPYDKLSPDNGRNVIGGSIFMNNLDLTHPLGYGYANATLPVFRKGTVFMDMPKNAYAAPLVYTNDPLISGYCSQENIEKARNSAAIVVSGTGRGRVILMADNPNFRAFWYGTNKLFANAIFFGQTISRGAVETK